MTSCRPSTGTCEVQTLFQESNLGCGLGVSTAITWFFANEERGIILEDDIIPDPTLLPLLRGAARPVRARSAGRSPSPAATSCPRRRSPTPTRPTASARSRTSGAGRRGAGRGRSIGSTSPAGASQLHPTRLWARAGRSLPASVYWASTFELLARKEVDTWDGQLVLASHGLAPADRHEQREPRREHRVRRDRDPHGRGPPRAARRRAHRRCPPPRSTSCWMRGPMRGRASTTSGPRGAGCSTRRIATVSSVEGGHRDDRQGPGPGHRRRGLHRLAPVRATARRRL